MIQINLLPEEEKKKRTIARYNFHLALICSALVILAILVATFSYSANMVLAAELHSLQSKVDQGKSLLKPYQELRDKVVFINDRVKELASLDKNRKSFAAILENLNKNIPSDIKVTSFSLNTNSKPEGKIAGTAPSKEKVAEFINLLEDSSYFQDVQFESSTPSQEKIGFNLTLSLEKGSQ